jgi:hypothetical protein
VPCATDRQGLTPSFSPYDFDRGQKLEFTITFVLVGLFVVYSLILFRKASRYSKKALLIIDSRIPSKVLLPILMIVIILTTIDICPGKHLEFLNLFLIILIGLAYIIFVTIIPISSFALSIIITEDGIFPLGAYPFLRLIPWYRIKKIKESFAYILIVTNKKYFPISLLKSAWKFSPEDIKQMQALLAKKKKLPSKKKNN